MEARHSTPPAAGGWLTSTGSVAAMRPSPRCFALLLAASATLTLAACGSSTTENAASTSAPTTAAPASTDIAATTVAGAPDDTAAGAPDASDAPPETAPPLPTVTEAPALPKPEVKIPATLPTELVITDLTEGTGPAAAAGDQVIVHYVGVRSADGTEFDNSYDRGQPFPVTLGQGGVIQGWDEGLVGVKAGGRRQLDIPSDLAYGDRDQGDVIKAGDALTFVVDVVAIIPKSDPADAPATTVAKLVAPVAEVQIEDLTPGKGDPVTGGQAVVQIVAYRADTGEQVNSTWEDGGAVTIPLDPGAGVLPGLLQGITGMAPGGRRQVTIPYAEAFGDNGNPNMGFPGKVDLILVIDLIASL